MRWIAVGAGRTPMRHNDRALSIWHEHAVQLIAEVNTLYRVQMLKEVRAVRFIHAGIIEWPTVIADIEYVIHALEGDAIDAAETLLLLRAAADVDLYSHSGCFRLHCTTLRIDFSKLFGGFHPIFSIFDPSKAYLRSCPGRLEWKSTSSAINFLPT